MRNDVGYDHLTKDTCKALLDFLGTLSRFGEEQGRISRGLFEKERFKLWEERKDLVSSIGMADMLVSMAEPFQK